MAALLHCSLDPNTFLQWPRPMGNDHLQAINIHISTGNCLLHHPPLKELIFDGPVTGTTPLLLACHYGELESVKYIVDSLGVDPRVPSTCYMNPFNSDMKIDSATPLFVAASRGHSKIVRFLLEKEVDVNAKTSNEAVTKFDGLTPLYGAVCDFWRSPNQPLDEQRAERNSIALSLLECGADPSASSVHPKNLPIWMNELCGVDTAIALINHGIDLKLHKRGKTILHHWASLPYDFSEVDSLPIIKLLAEKGADLMAKDRYGFTPILIAASAFIVTNDRHRRNLSALDFLLERDNISTIEKIEAMEMAGASILCDPGNATLFPKAFEYWRLATRRRLKRKRRSGACRKKTLGPNNGGGPFEWTTSNQLERVIQNPSEHVIQAFLVTLRILSSRSWGAVCSFVVNNLTGPLFENMKNDGKLLDVVDSHWATLRTLLAFLPRENSAWPIAVVVIDAFVKTLWHLLKKNPTTLNLEVVKRSLLLMLAIDKSRLTDSEQDEDTETIYTEALFNFLVFLLFSQSLKKIFKLWCRMLRQWGPHRLGSLVLVTCKKWEASVKNPNGPKGHFEIIRFLLRNGANVNNATDQDGNGPLHFVAQIDHHESETAGCLLLGFGAKLHRRNNAGKTAMDVWIERNEKEDNEEAALLRHRPDWCHSVPKLKCLAARCARAHKVPHLPWPIIHPFIENH